MEIEAPHSNIDFDGFDQRGDGFWMLQCGHKQERALVVERFRSIF